MTTPTSTKTAAIGSLMLRRFRAGELDGQTRAAIEKALTERPELRIKLQALDAEQAAFEAEVSFERFAGGVERAARELRLEARRPARAPWLATAGLGMAAAAVLALWARPSPSPSSSPPRAGDANRLKGADDDARAEVRVAHADGGPQAHAASGQLFSLRAGDRVRIGLRPRVDGHVAVLSVDERAVVTPLYPEAGDALAVASSSQPVFLPDSLSFDGSGREVLYVLFSHRAFTLEEILTTLARREQGQPLTVAERLARLPGFAISQFPFDKP